MKGKGGIEVCMYVGHSLATNKIQEKAVQTSDEKHKHT